jgi:hypothetical protein
MHPLPGNGQAGTYIHPFFLRYFGPLGRMPHFSLLILFFILIQLVKEGNETIPFTER